jgi:predicted GTPase
MTLNLYENEIILKNIFSFLPPTKLPCISLVCKKWKVVSESDDLWQNIYKAQFPSIDHSLIPNEERKNWKQRFREMKEEYRRLKNPIEVPILLNTNSERPNSLKIVCIGSVRVGKTTFVKRWVEREWNNEYNETNGTNYHFFNYQGNNIEIWDTSGKKKSQIIKKKLSPKKVKRTNNHFSILKIQIIFSKIHQNFILFI